MHTLTNAAAAFRAAAPSLAAAAPCKPPARTIVTGPVLGILRKTPAGVAGMGAFRLGERHDALAAGKQAMTIANERLVGEGAACLKTPAPAGVPLRQRHVTTEGAALSRRPVDASTLAALNDKHGPVQVMLPAKGAASGDKAASAGLKSTVMLANFEHEGRQIGLLLDGEPNDRHEVLRRLAAWRAERGDTQPLSELSYGDFAAFDASQPAGAARLYELAFRLVDLHALVGSAAPAEAAGAQGAAGSGAIAVFDRSTRLLEPPIPMLSQLALQDEIRRDPRLVG